jgi:hypothetical protein
MLKAFFKYRKKAIAYFGRHVEFNALTHLIGGIGLGIVIAAPLANPHPLRWALILLAIGIFCHIYAVSAKK